MSWNWVTWASYKLSNVSKCVWRKSAIFWEDLDFWQKIFAIKEGDHILIRFKCNLFSVSEYVVCANGHPSSIQDHESPMIIQGEYKVHLLNNKKRRNACLSCSSMICENISYIFPYTYFFFFFLLSLWVAVNSVPFPAVMTVIVGHPYFFQILCIYSSQSRDSRTFTFNTWCFNALEFICKTHVCKQINVLLGPTSFISKSCSKEEKMNIFWKKMVFFRVRHFNYSQAIIGLANWCWNRIHCEQPGDNCCVQANHQTVHLHKAKSYNCRYSSSMT